MRIRGVNEEGEGIAELLPTLSKSFADIGIEIRKDNDTFKSTYEIMSDLALKWDELTDIQKANITELVAGKRQGNIVVSMLNNWSDAENSLITALMSANSAIKENEKYMQSIQAKMAQFKNTVIGAWQQTLDSNTIKNFVVAMTTLVRVFGNLESVLAVGVTAILIWKGAAISTFIASIPGMVSGLIAITAGETAATVATVGLTSAFNALKLAFLKNPIGIVAVALTTLAGAFLLTKDAAEQTEEAVRNSMSAIGDKLYQIDQEKSALEVLGNKQKRLNEEINSGKLSTEQLSKKQAELKDVTEKVGLILDDETNKRRISNGIKLDEIDKIIELINVRKTEVTQQYQDQILMSQRAINGASIRILAYQKELDALNALENKKSTKLENAGFVEATGMFVGELFGKNNSKKIDELNKLKKEEKKIIEDRKKIMKDAQDALRQLSANDVGGTGALNPLSYSTSGGSSVSKLDYLDITKSHVESYNSLVDQDNAQEKLLKKQISSAEKAKDYSKQIRLQNDLLKVQQKTVSDLENANKGLSEYAQSIRDASKEFDTTKWFDLYGKDTEEYIRVYNSATSKEQQDKIKSVHDALATIKKAWYENKEAIDIYKESVEDTIVKTNELIETQYKNIVKNLKEVEQKQLDADEKELKRLNEISDQIIVSYKAQIEALEETADAQKEINERAEKQLEIQKLLLELENTRNERNKKILTKQPDGSWQWVWSADTSKIRDLENQISDKQTSLNRWEQEQITKHEKARLQIMIDAEEEKKKFRQNAFNTEKEEIDTFFKDLEDTTSTQLDSLNVIYGEKLNAILSTVRGYMSLINSSMGGSNKSSNSSLQTIDVQSNGKAPSGLSVGTVVKTAGGNYQITGFNKDGSYKSTKLAKGGEVDTTGYHWLDGKLGEPERVLSPEQTKSFNKLVDLLPNTLNFIDNIISNIKVPTPKLAIANAGNSNTTNYYISGVTVKANDGNQFISSLINIAKTK